MGGRVGGLCLLAHRKGRRCLGAVNCDRRVDGAVQKMSPFLSSSTDPHNALTPPPSESATTASLLTTSPTRSFCATNGASSTICAASDICKKCAAPASAQFVVYILTQVGQSPTQPCQSYASLLLHPCNLLMPLHPLDEDLDPPGLCNLGSVVYILTQVRQSPTSLLLHLKLLLRLIPISPEIL
jgi:hypothetical protein